MNVLSTVATLTSLAAQLQSMHAAMRDFARTEELRQIHDKIGDGLLAALGALSAVATNETLEALDAMKDHAESVEKG